MSEFLYGRGDLVRSMFLLQCKNAINFKPNRNNVFTHFIIQNNYSA